MNTLLAAESQISTDRTVGVGARSFISCRLRVYIQYILRHIQTERRCVRVLQVRLGLLGTANFETFSAVFFHLASLIACFGQSASKPSASNLLRCRELDFRSTSQPLNVDNESRHSILLSVADWNRVGKFGSVAATRLEKCRDEYSIVSVPRCLYTRCLDKRWHNRTA